MKIGTAVKIGYITGIEGDGIVLCHSPLGYNKVTYYQKNYRNNYLLLKDSEMEKLNG